LMRFIVKTGKTETYSHGISIR